MNTRFYLVINIWLLITGGIDKYRAVRKKTFLKYIPVSSKSAPNNKWCNTQRIKLFFKHHRTTHGLFARHLYSDLKYLPIINNLVVKDIISKCLTPLHYGILNKKYDKSLNCGLKLELHTYTF